MSVCTHAKTKPILRIPVSPRTLYTRDEAGSMMRRSPNLEKPVEKGPVVDVTVAKLLWAPRKL